MKARLAFYKGKGTLVDKSIRLWTNSPYSHVELVIGEMWYSSSPRVGGVRKKVVVPKEGNWDYVDVDVDQEILDELFVATQGTGYDWKGIVFNEILPFSVHSDTKWYCSEWCAQALGYEPAQMNPGYLFTLSKSMVE